MARICVLALLATIAAGCSGTSHVARRTPRPSSDPYVASLAYARCLRARGVPHPNPNRKGDFNLTPAQERRMRTVPKARRDAAMKACFHNLAALDNEPLSDNAHRRALKVLVQLKRCMHNAGYELGKPVVRNLSFGRAMFGFEPTDGQTSPRPRRQRAQLACERRVQLARKISRIIADDRRSPHGGF
jgi:hypothetical protein